MAEMLTGGLRRQKSNIRERSNSKEEFRLESRETTSSFSREQNKMVLLVGYIRKYEIEVEKVLFIYTSFLSHHSKKGGGRN